VQPYSPLGTNRLFGGTYRLYLQGRKVSQAKMQNEADNMQSFSPNYILLYPRREHYFHLFVYLLIYLFVTYLTILGISRVQYWRIFKVSAITEAAFFTETEIAWIITVIIGKTALSEP
jgi:hypothetical protein